MDAFVLPALGLVVICFLAVVWSTWLGKRNGRALAMSDDDDEPEESPSHRRPSR